MSAFMLEKLQRRVPEILAAAQRAVVQIDEVWTCVAPGAVTESAMAAVPAADQGWRRLVRGEEWGGLAGVQYARPFAQLGWNIPTDGGSNHWLRAQFAVPPEWQGQTVLLGLQWDDRGQASIEGIVYVAGEALSGLDEFHRSVLLPGALHEGAHEVVVRCYLPFPQRFDGLILILRDPVIFQLGHVMRALLEAVTTLAEHDAGRHALLEGLNAAYNALDLRAGWQGEQFAASAGEALRMLRATLAAQEAGRRPRLLATGHAHLDVAWLWPLWRTRQKVAHTVANALHLMERYPDYHFSMSQPQVYAFLQQDDPALYARMRARVTEGRFEPVGMMWLETDCNLPSGESLVRQMVHGARFWEREFGAQQHVVWLPDVFGYSAALPQIMRGCGVDTFMTTKISWNQFNRMPADTFRWRGIDGTSVLTHFVTTTDAPVGHPAAAQSYTYTGRMTGGEVAGVWRHYRQQGLHDELLYIYGWGDGGGGPTEEMLEAAQVFADVAGLPQVQLGRVNGFFERLYGRVWDDPRLPTWAGELYLEYHRGTYTSQGRTKQANRAAELLYREAEWLNAWAVSGGAPDQQAKLDEGWQLILLNQFHDILPGSSVPQVYVDSAAQYALIMERGAAVAQEALRALVGQEWGSAAPPVVVVNSLPWERRDVVRLPVGDQALRMINAAGDDLPQQVVEDEEGAASLLVLATVPPYGLLGLQQVAEDEGKQAAVHAPVLLTRRNWLASGELRLELDDHGEVGSLFDVRYEREVIAPGERGNQVVAYEDRPLRWDAWDIDPFYLEKAYPVREVVDWRVVEDGPIRSAIELVREVGTSRIRQRVCVWQHQRRVDWVTTIEWQERQTLLRALFPLNINATQATCEIQFGAVERPTHRNTSWDAARFEVCAQRWVDLSEGDYGVALLNNGKYGHSLDGHTLGLSLLKGGVFPDPDADRGMHRFTYSLLPHGGDWRAAAVVRRAYELNAPLRGVATGGTGSAAEKTVASFVGTACEHVVVETIKRAADGDGLIVRLYEAHNQRGPVVLEFGQAVASAEEVDLLERPRAAVEYEGRTVRCAVRPFEIKTLRVRLRR